MTFFRDLEETEALDLRDEYRGWLIGLGVGASIGIMTLAGVLFPVAMCGLAAGIGFLVLA